MWIETACLNVAGLFYALATVLLHLVVPSLGGGLPIAVLYPAVYFWIVVLAREALSLRYNLPW